MGLRERFPKLARVNDIAKNHVQGVVINLRDAGKFDDALAAIDKNQDLSKIPRMPGILARAVYDAWAGGLRGKGDWQGAVNIYAKA